MITNEQVKAARKLLGWSQITLSIEADVSIPTVVGFERGQKRTRDIIVLKMKKALEQAGAIFDDEDDHGPGVALRKKQAGTKPKA
jgi:transcriptional regulator with XRE-family HTH domain